MLFWELLILQQQTMLILKISELFKNWGRSKFILGSLSKCIFERCTSTGSELLSLLICHNSSKFLLLSVYGLINCPRIDTVHFWLTCVAQKRLCLSSLLCTKLFLDTMILIVFGVFNPKFNIYIQILQTELHTFPYSRTPITQTPF